MRWGWSTRMKTFGETSTGIHQIVRLIIAFLDTCHFMKPIRLLERGPTCEPRRMRVASLVAVMAPVDEEDENSDEAKAKPPGQPIPMPSPPSTSSGTPLETVEAQEPVDTVETQEPENMVETDVKRRRLGLNKQDPKSDK